jgi:hypothetical protein
MSRSFDEEPKKPVTLMASANGASETSTAETGVLSVAHLDNMERPSSRDMRMFRLYVEVVGYELAVFFAREHRLDLPDSVLAELNG